MYEYWISVCMFEKDIIQIRALGKAIFPVSIHTNNDWIQGHMIFVWKNSETLYQMNRQSSIQTVQNFFISGQVQVKKQVHSCLHLKRACA